MLYSQQSASRNRSNFHVKQTKTSCFASSSHLSRDVPGWMDNDVHMQCMCATHPALHSACLWMWQSGRTSPVHLAGAFHASSTPKLARQLEWKVPDGLGRCGQTATSLRATAAMLSCSLTLCRCPETAKDPQAAGAQGGWSSISCVSFPPNILQSSM